MAMDDQIVIQEAAFEGLKGMDHLIRLLSHHQNPISSSSLNQLDCREITDFTIAKFKQVISVLNRAGHARFRRGPVSSSSSSTTTTTTSSGSPHTSDPASLSLSPAQIDIPAALKTPVNFVQSEYQPKTMTLDFSKPNLLNSKLNPKITEIAAVSNSQSVSLSTTASSSFMSSITAEINGEGSVSNGKLGTSLFASPVVTAGKPPLASSSKKRCRDHDHQTENVSGGADNCHCTKRRKERVKNTVRVPAISSKVADIPNDECSWRKYGQKPIKGSPYPRGYYRCSSMRGCPAKKHVERDPDEPTMLIVTYEGVHRHSNSAFQGNIAGDSAVVSLS